MESDEQREKPGTAHLGTTIVVGLALPRRPNFQKRGNRCFCPFVHEDSPLDSPDPEKLFTCKPFLALCFKTRRLVRTSRHGWDVLR
ncbi:MAG: hypothetical protein JWM68_1486 [Verrucomicrobiales bacterium]|nr:hypothetical protein [Verrucomicrobiales bacterium]